MYVCRERVQQDLCHELLPASQVMTRNGRKKKRVTETICLKLNTLYFPITLTFSCCCSFIHSSLANREFKVILNVVMLLFFFLAAAVCIWKKQKWIFEKKKKTNCLEKQHKTRAKLMDCTTSVISPSLAKVDKGVFCLVV